MAPEDQSDTSQQTAASDGEQGAENQSSPAVIEINDSMTECEEEARPNLVKIEEKAFIARLHSFMKDRATPIERIPHLGFKQINLWRIHKAVDKLGGYDSVTARRLWKKVYDELGGSPGSTSAATCTRRHYEKLVLPFERYLKGEEDKPLPPSKPRKPYKRSLDSQVNKVERKRKRSQLDSDVDPEILAQRSPDTPGQSEAVMHPRRALWSSDPHHPDASQPNRAATSVCTTIYTRLVPVPVGTSNPWSASVPSTTAEVISPLEKKKRMAQASLNGHQSPQSEDKERPSVIHCSPSPSRASSTHNSTDGSPMPLSSSSSRSPSPYSVSSEDGPVGSENKPVPPSELPLNCSSSVKNSSSGSENSKSARCTQPSKDSARQRKDVSYASAQSGDSIKVQNKDSAWRPIHRGSSKYIAHPFLPPSSYVISDWPTSTSSFTKVIPKSMPLPRPAPIRPSCKIPQGRLMQQDDSLTSVKKQNNMAPWIYPAEKREKSRTMLQKVSSTQQSASHSAASLQLPSVLSRYEKSGRDSRHQHAFYPAFLPNRMRPPHPQFMYHNVPTHSAIIGSAVYPHPFSIPLLNPQLGYALPAMGPIYQHKM